MTERPNIPVLSKCQVAAPVFLKDKKNVVRFGLSHNAPSSQPLPSSDIFETKLLGNRGSSTPRVLSTADFVVFPGDLRFLLRFFIECDPSTPGHGSFTSGSPISGTTTACNEQLSVKACTILLRTKVCNPPLSVCDDVLSLQACTYAYVHSLMHSLTLNLDFSKFLGLKRKPIWYYAT